MSDWPIREETGLYDGLVHYQEATFLAPRSGLLAIVTRKIETMTPNAMILRSDDDSKRLASNYEAHI